MRDASICAHTIKIDANKRRVKKIAQAIPVLVR